MNDGEWLNMSSNWKSKNIHKYLLQYHMVFVYKYRKKLLSDKTISDDIKQFSYGICHKHNVAIHETETDKDHIHYMIETGPDINLSNLVRTMKPYTAYHIWKLHRKYLSKEFWEENTFWTDGYFICSIGNVSGKQLWKYIKNKDRKRIYK